MYNVHIARQVNIREERFRTLEMEIETLSKIIFRQKKISYKGQKSTMSFFNG